ncbi:hypothetical protein BC828DRAFT_164914 [Blastocladiella britannica]|nr:hypothetical protein BC828DRAFT_164914 [Blastocladiella britannica]
MYWELATGTCLWFTVTSQLFGKHIFEQPVAVCTTLPSPDVTIAASSVHWPKAKSTPHWRAPEMVWAIWVFRSV